MNTREYARRTETIDLAFSALPGAPVHREPEVRTSSGDSTPSTLDTAVAVRQVRRRIATGLRHTATWVEPGSAGVRAA